MVSFSLHCLVSMQHSICQTWSQHCRVFWNIQICT
jgi:hypothetical protein